MEGDCVREYVNQVLHRDHLPMLLQEGSGLRSYFLQSELES